MYFLLAIVALVATASAKDLIAGQEEGRLIFEQNVTASPAIWRQEEKVTVNAAVFEVITRVVVIDNREDKNGEAAIVEGGEGHKNVTIELKSPAIFRGFDFKVQVYAKYGGQQDVQRPVPNDQQSIQIPMNSEDGQQTIQKPKDVHKEADLPPLEVVSVPTERNVVAQQEQKPVEIPAETQQTKAHVKGLPLPYQ